VAGLALLVAGALAAGALVLGTVAVVRWAWLDHECTVAYDGRSTDFSTAQAEEAARIVARGTRDGRPGQRTVDRVAEVLEPDEPSDDDRADARLLVTALTGRARAALTCDHGGATQAGRDRLDPTGLTPRADTVRRDLVRDFGDVPMGGFAPGGVRAGHMKGSAHYDGRAIDVFFRPINPGNKRAGWAMAQYLVASADRLKIETVIFDGRIWTARRADQGWREYHVDTWGESKETARILEHRDHVHVDVAD
jgi:hypothetical protein